MAVETNILPPRYRGPQRIGRGGMGEIFRATDSTLGRAVAVKVLAQRYSQDESVRERFTREALAAARLSGEASIVTIFDVGEWNDRPFIVMEYLANGSLDDYVREQGTPSPQQALEWLEQAAQAIDSAHRHGVVHRDLKPGNLLLDRNSELHVADFGIASAAGLDSLTMTGTVLGTAGYLAPEQAQGERATDASDRYSLGVVAFELLTGTRPFEGESMTAEAAAHVHAPVPSISEREPSLPHELDPVFERALAKDPSARYPSAAEFVAELRNALAEAAGQTRELAAVPAPAPPSAWPAGGRGRRRSAMPLVLGALGLAALLGGIALAAALTGSDGKDKAAGPRVVVKTVTGEGTTATVTNVQSSASAAPTTAVTGAGRSTSDGVGLTDQSTALIRNGDYQAALPLAQQALEALQGSGQTYEAYANYNVGTSLIHLGRCSEGLPYLDRSEALQGHRAEISHDRALCQGGDQAVGKKAKKPKHESG